MTIDEIYKQERRQAMTLEEIRKALIGKRLKYNRKSLMVVDDCMEEDGKIKLTDKKGDLDVYLSMEMAEKLATHGIYKWWGEYVYSPVCGIMGDQTLRLIEKQHK